jgi:hypothetical protein
MEYSRKDSLIDSLKKNRKCKKCSQKGELSPNYGKKLSKETLEKMKKSNTWFKPGQRPSNADFRKGKTLEEIYGQPKATKIIERYSQRKIHTLESNLKRSASCIIAKCGSLNKGRKCSDENRKKFRLLAVERLKATKKNFHPGYNTNACYFFNRIMKKTGTNIKHALNSGEYYISDLGYWIDGYDLENNIVYEFDEKYVNYNILGNYQEKDIIKQKEITNLLKCTFIRIKLSDVAVIKNRKFVEWKNNSSDYIQNLIDSLPILNSKKIPEKPTSLIC